MNPTGRFDGRGDAYARFRPSWPTVFVRRLLDGFKFPVVADVGAGTGLSAQALHTAGARVICIEPNASMRASMSQQFETVAGTAEATNLAAASVDVVTAFQAYHWFDGPAFLAEASRIGRRPYRVVAAWYDRDRSQPFTNDYEAVIAHHGEALTVLDRLRRTAGVEEEMRAAGLAVRRFSVVEDRAMDWESLTGFIRSCSYLPDSGAAYERLVAEVRPVYDSAVARGEAFFRWRFTAFIGEIKHSAPQARLVD